MKTSVRSFVTVTLMLLGLVLLPKARAVVPPPDGGYPNFNTAEGQKALQNLTTGAANTAVGWFSLFSDAAGSFNTATCNLCHEGTWLSTGRHDFSETHVYENKHSMKPEILNSEA